MQMTAKCMKRCSTYQDTIFTYEPDKNPKFGQYALWAGETVHIFFCGSACDSVISWSLLKLQM